MRCRLEDFKKVTSRENPLIKLVSSLQKSASARRENGLFVLEGLRLCADACDNGIRFDKLIISFSAADGMPKKSRNLHDAPMNAYPFPIRFLRK